MSLLLVALLVVAGLGSFTLAELSARWWIRHRKFYSVLLPGHHQVRHLDPSVFVGFPTPVHFDVNRDGERGDDLPSSPRGLYRVLMAGGSLVECYALDQAVTFPGALQAVLNQPENLKSLAAERVHVGNIGRSGFGSVELRLALERVLPRYPRLDAIVILVGTSDVLHWMARRAPAQYPPRTARVSEVFACHPEGPFGWHLVNLALVELLRRARSGKVSIEHGAGASLENWREMRARAKEILTAMPDTSCLANHFEENLRALLSAARTRADRVLVISQPRWDKKLTAEEEAKTWACGVGYPWKSEVTTYFSFDVLFEALRQLNLCASRVAAELGVEHMDVANSMDRNLQTFYDSLHVTPLGAAQMAEAVAAKLAQGRAATSPRSSGGDHQLVAS